jgi:hypothetical protein
MASSKQTFRIRQASTGRTFAAMDPERRPETVMETASIRVAPIEVRPSRPVQIDWMRAQLQRDGGLHEGGRRR